MTDFLEAFRRELQALPPGHVGAAVDLLLSTLDPRTARLVRLTAIPHQFTFELLPVLDPSLTPDQASDLGAKLISLSVILPGERQFAVHDEVRDYLFHQWLVMAERDEFASVSSRLVDHFAARLRGERDADTQQERYQLMFHRLGADQEAGFDEFLKLFAKARRENRLHDCERLIALVEEYHPVLTPSREALVRYQEGKLNADRHRWDVAASLFERVASAPGSTEQLRAKALTRLGTAQGQQGRWAGAKQSFERALGLLTDSAACRRERGWILHEWGVVLREEGDTDEAQRLLCESVAIAEAEGRWEGLAAGHNSLGSLYRRRGDHHKAIDAYEEALHHLLANDETFRSAQVYNNLGRSLGDIGEWQRSEEYLQKSLDIKRHAGDTRGRAVTLSNLMRTYWNLGKFAEAATAGATASELFLELNEVSRAAEVTRDAARLSHRNQRDTAEHGFRRAAELFKLAGKPAEAEQVEAELAALGEEATPRGVRVMVIGCAVLTALGVATFLVLLVLTW